MKTFTKGIVSTIATIAIVTGVVYAATINSVTTQSIISGTTMGAGWFQDVNDHINGGSLCGGGVLPENAAHPTILCKGNDPRYSCPSGYTRANPFGAYGNYFWTCVKS